MKKCDKKRFFGIVGRLALVVLVVCLVMILPTYSLVGKDEMEIIYKNFLGNKSKYQGVIEIWNIDTFESGSASKTSHIANISKLYQSQNRGIYIMVRNLTETECMNMLSSGQKPDLFSCSYGIADKVREYLQPFSSEKGIDIKQEFLEAGKAEGKLYGLAWCRGVYCLISTNKQLEKAKVEDIENVKLQDLVLKLGYKTTNKKDESITYSVTYGAGGYALPNNAINSYNSSGLEMLPEYAIDKEAAGQTQYSAYCNFISGKSTILLGSQRDIVRMQNRVKLGKVTDVIYEPLYDYCDLVQFIFLTKTEDKNKLWYMEDFAKFMTSDACQEKLSNIQMFPVAKLKNNPYKSGIMFDIVSEFDRVCKVPNVFAA